MNQRQPGCTGWGWRPDLQIGPGSEEGVVLRGQEGLEGWHPPPPAFSLQHAHDSLASDGAGCFVKQHGPMQMLAVVIKWPRQYLSAA